MVDTDRREATVRVGLTPESEALLSEIQGAIAAHTEGTHAAARAVVTRWEEIQQAALDIDLPRMFALMHEFSNPIADLASWVSED